MNNESKTSNRDIYLDILSDIKTVSDLSLFLSSINDLASSLYELKGGTNEKISKYLSNQQKDKIIAYCRDNQINIEDPISLQKFLFSLSDELKTVPQITLYLVSEPKDKVINQISEWIYLNLNKKILLNIQIDRKIIGGAVIVYKGIYKDYSLNEKLDQMLSEGKLNLNNLLSGEVDK